MPEYRLLQPHRINRVLQPIGYVVSLPEQTGDWLVLQAVAEPIVVVMKTAQVGKTERPDIRRAQTVVITPRFSCCGWKRPKK